MCVYTYPCISIYMCVHVYIYIYICDYLYKFMRVYIQYLSEAGFFSRPGEVSVWGIVKIMASFLGPHYNTGSNTGPNLGYPKRDHNFDNQP